MTRVLKWKIILLATLVAFAGVTLLPSFTSTMPDWWRKHIAPEGLHLGLDLQGGMHLVLKVDIDKAVENSLEFASQDLKSQLKDQKISVVQTPSADRNQVVFTLPNADSVATVEQVVSEDFPNLNINIMAEAGSFPRIIIKLSDDQIGFID